jgi:hypothetical protein
MDSVFQPYTCVLHKSEGERKKEEKKIDGKEAFLFLFSIPTPLDFLVM